MHSNDSSKGLWGWGWGGRGREGGNYTANKRLVIVSETKMKDSKVLAMLRTWILVQP